MKCSDLIEILEKLAPSSMACEWDNPGLLAGRSDKEVTSILLAVDLTDSVLDQAEAMGADMIITHHPLIFKPLKKVNDQDFISRRILRLIQKDISYYAMHTNFDAAPGCMADLAGERLGLTDCRPLEPMGTMEDGRSYGIGLLGTLPEGMTLRETAEKVKEAFGIPFVTVFGDVNSPEKLQRAAICPGSGGSTLKEALAGRAEVYITGDIGHHEGIDAVACGMAVIDAGHYGIEHIFMGFMEKYLKEKLGKEMRIRQAAEEFPQSVL
ncbi:MAG: Nif3-like dinuclear metal center hexameric protein [Clostridiaceae bacterium]|nr:Nif3-like dinuclear metal center hexameric protein [Clostridiaceae bacterium]MDD6072902.1 Nif3-like dinuclear metal center hexameric protein [Clostridium sp.]